MPAMLIVREGRRHFTFELRKKETVIGRDPAADIIVVEPSTSRRHAVVAAGPDGTYVVRDLESKNGTLVNGSRIKEKELKWGDQISVGPMSLLFVAREEEETGVDRRGSGKPKTGIHRAKTMGLNVSDLDLTVVKKPRPHHVNSFFQIASVLPLYRDSERAGEAMLDILLANFKGSRSAILFFGPDESSLLAHELKRSAQEEFGSTIDYRDDLLKLIRATGRAFLQDEEYTAIYVPVPHEGKPFGALYLDTFQQPHRLTEDDLWVLSGIAIQYAVILQDLRYREKLEREKLALEESASPGQELLGDSPAMKEVLSRVAQAAGSDAPILVHGENGTGKELAARAIHQASRRRAGPFVALNCAACSIEEMQDALFGHDKSSEEGSTARKGALERAAGGTLFLDHIGSMDRPLQALLHAALEHRIIRRQGGQIDIPIDIRLIAGSPLRPEEMAETAHEEFLRWFPSPPISIPPLRERTEDIPLLAAHFVKKFASRVGKRIEGLEPDVLDLLSRHGWPGNVRELSNALERAVLYASGPRIGRDDLAPRWDVFRARG
jgi:pSer/pThr/pTyr-binding forkhead associated (FHA) protein